MAGEYDKSTKLKMEAEYILGGANACIGVSRIEGEDHYFPRSCLCEDIRNIKMHTSQVLAIFQAPYTKNKTTSEFRKIVYVAKGINLRNIVFPNEIIE